LLPKDEKGWESLMNILGEKIFLAGEDLYEKGLNDLKTKAKKYLSNTMVLKLSSFSCLSELVEAVKFAKTYNYKVVLSQEFSETNDDLLADLAVGFNFDFIKAGSLSRGERVGKYNRLLEISGEIAKK
jgi:enolase